MKKRLAAGMAVVMMLSTGGSVLAESGAALEKPASWPEGTITYECGYNAGGTQDLMVRDLARFAAEITGNDYVVDNITGGSGLIMVNDVFSRDADGTTACIYSCTIPTVADFEYFDPELLASLVKADLQIGEQMTAVSQVNTDYPAMFVPKTEERFQTLEELGEYVQAHPGEVSFGATGASGNGGLMLQTLMNKFNWDINDVYYDSTPENQAAVLSGDIDVMCATVAANVGEDWTCLGYAAEEPDAAYPDIKTFKEAGFDFVAVMRRGMFVKKGTDQAIVDYMDDMYQQITSSQEYLDSQTSYGYAVDYMDSEAFQAAIDEVVEGYNSFATK